MTEKKKKEFCIVEGPVRVKSKTGGHPLMYRGNDGNWYLQKELAAKIPMAHGSFCTRLRKLGPFHPDLFKKHRKGGGHQAPTGHRAPLGGLGDLAKLSGKPRRHNLAKIPPLSKFERQQGEL